MNEKSSATGASILAGIQFILHYLSLIGIIGGALAFLASNSGRAFQLILGGIGLMILKYILGFIFVPILMKRSFKDIFKENMNRDN